MNFNLKNVISNLIVEGHLADIFSRYLEVWFLSQKRLISFSSEVAQNSTFDDGNKNCSLDTNLTFYWNSKFETRLEIELSVEKVA